MRSLRWQLLVTCVVILSIVLVPIAAAQSDGVYFPQTGHTVKEPFLTFFNEHGGVARFGYPITSAYTDPATGMYIQYFQRARFEWHPENPERYRVQLGLLSDELGKRQPPIPVSKVSTSDPSCYFFEATGHLACHKFLQFWKDNGGLDIFGYPISGYVMENNRIVQYFQRARFEWHPEKPDGQRVQLAPLGEMYFEKMGIDPRRLKGDDTGIGPTSVVTSLHARGNVADAVIARGYTETAYVTVVDQLNKPVAGVKVTMIVHFPSGDQYFTLPDTDSRGTTSHTFPAGKYTPGTVISIEFNATYGTLTTTTRTSYLMWFY